MCLEKIESWSDSKDSFILNWLVATKRLLVSSRKKYLGRFVKFDPAEGVQLNPLIRTLLWMLKETPSDQDCEVNEWLLLQKKLLWSFGHWHELGRSLAKFILLHGLKLNNYVCGYKDEERFFTSTNAPRYKHRQLTSGSNLHISCSFLPHRAAGTA